jgi:hypothetical protein
MRRKELKLKGLRVPRIFIWILGVIHGKLLKTATIDPNTNYVSSSYITGKIKLFSELTAKYINRLEYELKAVRTEASELMVEEAILSKEIEELPELEVPITIQQKRDFKRITTQKEGMQKRHQEILNRLVEIDAKVKSREMCVKEALEATAKNLQSCFSTYGHGVMLQPIFTENIPPVDYETSFETYLKTYEKENCQMEYVLKEVFSHG